MRFVISIALLAFIPLTMLDAAGEKKVKPGCKKSELAGLVLNVCVPEMNIAGTEINCTITLTNTSKDTIDFEHIALHRTFIVEIKDAKGAVPLTQFGKRMFAGKDVRFTEKKLSPGDTVELTYNLSRCFDLSLADDYSLNVVSRLPMVKDMKISVESIPLSVQDP